MNVYILPALIMIFFWAHWMWQYPEETQDILFNSWRDYVWYSQRDRAMSLVLWGYLAATIEMFALVWV